MPSKNFDRIIINESPYDQLRAACKELGLRENHVSYRIHLETTAIPPSSEFAIKSGGKKFKIKLVKENNDTSN